MKFVITLLLLSTSYLLSAQNKSAASSDSLLIKSKITNFYKWYNKNWKKIDAFRLYTGKGKEGYNPPYKINKKEVDRYFAHLRKNVLYVGETFIKNERQHFKWADSMFAKNPEDEITSGFDYDRFTQTQEEPQYFLDELLKKNNRWVVSITKNIAIAKVFVKDTSAENQGEWKLLCAEMVKEKGNWKIARLNCNTDEEE
jgi:hypothetical protein